MFKRLLIVLLFLILFVEVALSGELITIRDMANRPVKVPKEPKRIVALGGTLRYVVYLQALDRIVGVEAVEKTAEMKGIRATGRPYNLAIKEKIRDLPVIGEGGPGKLPDPERLLLVKADLVLAVEPEQAKVVEEKTGIPVVLLKVASPAGWSFEDLKEVLLFLGNLLGKEGRAKELIKEVDLFLEDIKRRVPPKGGPTVYVGGVSYRGSHGLGSTEANFPPFVLLRAENVADKIQKKGHLFLDRETLLRLNPEYIFLDTAGLPLIREDLQKNPAYFEALKAFKEGKAFSLFPINFYRTNPEVVMLNTYFIGKVLYPQAFKDVNPEAKAREIFKKFLGVDVFDELRKDFPGFKRVSLEGRKLILRDL